MATHRQMHGNRHTDLVLTFSQSVVPFLMLHIGMSIACKPNGILNVLCNVQLPVKNAAAIPLDEVANVILLLIEILVK